MTEPQRIAIFRGGAVGDFIVTIPALQGIRSAWKDAEIHLFAYPRVQRLALETGLADRFVSLDSRVVSGLFSADCSNSEELFKDFGLAISFLHDPDGFVHRNLLKCGVRNVLSLSPIVTQGHAVEHFAGILRMMQIPAPDSSQASIQLTGPHKQRGATLAAQFGHRILAIHPGSGSRSKNWPLANFLELAGRAHREMGLTPVFTAGEADEAIVSKLKGAGTFVILPSQDLVDLAGFLSLCSCYVGNDSGITHLAAATGIKTIALFGPTDPDRWAPCGSNVLVLKAECDVSELKVDQVYDALKP